MAGILLGPVACWYPIILSSAGPIPSCTRGRRTNAGLDASTAKWCGASRPGSAGYESWHQSVDPVDGLA